MNLIKNQLHKELAAVVTKLYPGIDSSIIDISYPPEHFKTDYASSVPWRLSKTLGKKPQEITQACIAELNKRTFILQSCKPVTAEGGFINFVLQEGFVFDTLNVFLKNGSKSFLKDADVKKQKVLNEFISANPTGPITMGNARGAFLGDILSRVLRVVGHDVENEYYVNNAKNSKQIQELGKTFLGQGESYLTPWLKGVIKTVSGTLSAKGVPDTVFDAANAGYTLAKRVHAHNKTFIETKLGIHFDRWFEENMLYTKNEVSRTLAVLKQKNLMYEKEGATWCATTAFGDDEDRVLVRADGEATYFLADIAYHINKYRRGYDRIIDIWGADHQGHVKRLYAALKALGYDTNKLHIIITQLVRLVKNGEFAKISKRAGIYVTLEELVDEVGIDAARFFFLMRSPETHIDFDLALAQEKSEKNPVYYIQYAYVRASSILEKAGGQFRKKWNFKKETTLAPHERALAIQILRLPELIYDIAKNFQAHRMITFASEFAREFHNFYEKSRVISEQDKKIREMRLALCRAARCALHETFDLMGISKPERM